MCAASSRQRPQRALAAGANMFVSATALTPICFRLGPLGVVRKDSLRFVMQKKSGIPYGFVRSNTFAWPSMRIVSFR